MCIPILFSPPLGIIISAYFLEGSTNCSCIGFTVVTYWFKTDSTVLPLSCVSLNIRLINLSSASVSTNTFISIKSLSLGSSNINIPSNIITFLG